MACWMGIGYPKRVLVYKIERSARLWLRETGAVGRGRLVGKGEERRSISDRNGREGTSL